MAVTGNCTSMAAADALAADRLTARHQTATMDQPTPDPPGKPASEAVTAVLVRGAIIFNALMPERFVKPSPLCNTLFREERGTPRISVTVRLRNDINSRRGARCGSGVSACTVDRFGWLRAADTSEPVIVCAGISPVASGLAGVVAGGPAGLPGKGQVQSDRAAADDLALVH